MGIIRIISVLVLNGSVRHHNKVEPHEHNACLAERRVQVRQACQALGSFKVWDGLWPPRGQGPMGRGVGDGWGPRDHGGRSTLGSIAALVETDWIAGSASFRLNSQVLQHPVREDLFSAHLSFAVAGC